MIWQPTWEAAEPLLANPDFRTYVASYENADTSTQLNAQSEDQKIDNLTKQGYDGCTLKICGTRHKAKTSETRQSLSRALSIPKQTFNPRTWKCEIWVRDVDLLKPGSNKDSEDEPKIPEHTTCQAACAYDIYGKCTSC